MPIRVGSLTKKLGQWQLPQRRPCFYFYLYSLNITGHKQKFLSFETIINRFLVKNYHLNLNQKIGQYPRRPTQSGTVPLFVEQRPKKCGTAPQKVKQVLKAGHCSTNCGTVSQFVKQLLLKVAVCHF